MNEITTYRWSWEEDIDNYLEAGYSGIGVWRSKISDGDVDDVVDRITGSGLNVTHVSWAGGFTGSDGRTFSEGVEDSLDALRLAAALRAGCVVVYSGGRNNHILPHAGRLLRHALDKLLPFAEDLEIPLALEPMHATCAKEWTFLTDLSAVMMVLEEYRSPYLKIAYDTYHFPIHGRQRDVLKRIAPHIGIVHLGDRQRAPSAEQERCLLGAGRLQLGDVIGTLQEAGYAGNYDIKLYGSDMEAYDYWTILEQSQQVFSELAPVAAERTMA